MHLLGRAPDCLVASFLVVYIELCKQLTMCLLPGEGAPLPEHPYPGQSWREIRHDKTVTWLAFWKGACLLMPGHALIALRHCGSSHGAAASELALVSWWPSACCTDAL